MKRIPVTAQNGYALILMVLGLMVAGGVVLAGFSEGSKQAAEQQRYLHNERILKEAPGACPAPIPITTASASPRPTAAAATASLGVSRGNTKT